jgi:hypothetical protein
MHTHARKENKMKGRNLNRIIWMRRKTQKYRWKWRRISEEKRQADENGGYRQHEN